MERVDNVKKYKDLPLEQVGTDTFRYGYRGNYGGAWVLAKREKNGLWYYVRLGHISESRRFHTFQECLDAAYVDILRSKF